jgi:hypothetical protein
MTVSARARRWAYRLGFAFGASIAGAVLVDLADDGHLGPLTALPPLMWSLALSLFSLWRQWRNPVVRRHFNGWDWAAGLFGPVVLVAVIPELAGFWPVDPLILGLCLVPVGAVILVGSTLAGGRRLQRQMAEFRRNIAAAEAAVREIGERP